MRSVISVKSGVNTFFAVLVLPSLRRLSSPHREPQSCDRDLLLICVVCSLAYAQAQLANAIQQAYNLQAPPVLTLEYVGKPTGNDQFSESTTQVHVFFFLYIKR